MPTCHYILRTHCLFGTGYCALGNYVFIGGSVSSWAGWYKVFGVSCIVLNNLCGIFFVFHVWWYIICVAYFMLHTFLHILFCTFCVSQLVHVYFVLPIFLHMIYGSIVDAFHLAWPLDQAKVIVLILHLFVCLCVRECVTSQLDSLTTKYFLETFDH